MHEYTELEKSTMVPVFDKLVADGLVLAYGLDTQDFHTGKIGRASFHFITADADTLDKVDQVLDEAFGKMPGTGLAFRSLVSPDSHSDFLCRVPTMTNK